MVATAPAIDLASLPSDILLEILQDCDERIVYHLAWTCRALHIAALTILFRHHAKDLDQGKLSLVSFPDFILPAVHGALFVRDLNSIYIHMRNSVGTLYRDLRIIKDLIARSTSLTYLTLDFSGLGAPACPTNGGTTVDRLCKVLRELMDLAIERNCEWLNIMSDTDIERIFPPIRLQSDERPRRSNALSQLLGKIGHALGNRDADSKGMASDPNISRGASPDDMLPAAKSTVKSTSGRYANTKLDYITLSSQLWFEEPMWDWTFNILKSPKIGTLRIDQDSFILETWLRALPLIHIPTLRRIDYTAVKQPIPMKEFTAFFTRHSPHIRHLTLLLNPFPPQQKATKRIPAINFQSLEQLHSSPSTISWVLAAAKAACPTATTPCLPRLTHLTFQEPQVKRGYISVLNETDWSGIDTALTTLSTLASRQISPAKERWLTTLEIQCIDLFDDWLKPHISDPSSSPLASLRNLTHLVLYKVRQPFGDSEIEMFPQLWAFFPELEQVSIQKVWMDRLKAMAGVKYWKRVRRDCPKLKDVTCNWTVDLKMDDLLRDDWPEISRATWL